MAPVGEPGVLRGERGHGEGRGGRGAGCALHTLRAGTPLHGGAHSAVAAIGNDGRRMEFGQALGERGIPHATPARGAVMGARSWIGAGAVVRQGVRIGDDVAVGAGAVVVRDVAAGSTVPGVPGKAFTRG